MTLDSSVSVRRREMEEKMEEMEKIIDGVEVIFLTGKRRGKKHLSLSLLRFSTRLPSRKESPSINQFLQER